MNAPTVNRRDALKLIAVGFGALQLPAAEPGAPVFFTKDQFALLDQLTELIIPADRHSGGARAAGVAPFIDRMVAEAFTAEEKDSWRTGLSAVDEFSNAQHRMPFLKLSADQQKACLEQLSGTADSASVQSNAEKFFPQLKQTTAFVYYSSSLGIHGEMAYKGNVLLPQFVGYDAT